MVDNLYSFTNLIFSTDYAALMKHNAAPNQIHQDAGIHLPVTCLCINFFDEEVLNAAYCEYPNSSTQAQPQIV